MLREKVPTMKAIWAGNNAEFHGEFVDFAPILTGLRPRQQPHPPILIGGQGSRGIAHTVEYGDAGMPIVYDELDLGTQMLELERRCQEAGKPTAPVTAAIFEVDKQLIERCAELGVERCVVVFHTEDKEGLPAFLERYTRVPDRFSD